MKREGPFLSSSKRRIRPILSRRLVLTRLVPLAVGLLLTTSIFLNLSVLSSTLATKQQQQNSELRQTCQPAPIRTETPGKPLWVPGYPGSGSELFRDLLHTVTGLQAADVYEATGVQSKDAGTMTCASPATLTCKTHWPMIHKRHPWRPARLAFMSRSVVLLLRNPAMAIPSHFNFVWEASQQQQQQQQQQKQNGSSNANRTTVLLDHTTQAPEAEWRKWRDEHLHHQVQVWMWTITRWNLDPVPESNATEPYFHVSLYVPYEELIATQTGPQLLRAVLDELRREGHSTVGILPNDTTAATTVTTATATATTATDCLWRQVVKERPRKKRRGHTYTPGYTRKQQAMMLKVLRTRLLDQPVVQEDAALQRILEGYEYEIQHNLRIDEE